MLPFSETYIPSKNCWLCQPVCSAGKTVPGLAKTRQRGVEVRDPYLTDILVSHSADLLDVCRALGYSLKRVTSDGQLVLLALGDLDIDTTLHGDPAHELLADEVTVFFFRQRQPSRLQYAKPALPWSFRRPPRFERDFFFLKHTGSQPRKSRRSSCRCSH